MLLDSLHPKIRVLTRDSPAEGGHSDAYFLRYRGAPAELRTHFRECGDVELSCAGRYLRLWSPDGAIGMDDGYGISRRLGDVVPFGDNGGSQVVLLGRGPRGYGLYRISFGALDWEEAHWISAGLLELLRGGEGLDAIGDVRAT